LSDSDISDQPFCREARSPDSKFTLLIDPNGTSINALSVTLSGRITVLETPPAVTYVAPLDATQRCCNVQTTGLCQVLHYDAGGRAVFCTIIELYRSARHS
jgi:hypothetical protein